MYIHLRQDGSGKSSGGVSEFFSEREPPPCHHWQRKDHADATEDRVDGPPFAVKKVASITLGKEIIISSENKMIKGLDLPKNVTLYIKGSENNYVDDKMLDLFESEALNLLSNTSYVVD